MSSKPSLPKGTRDFGPLETSRRNFIFGTIRKVFELYGYRAIETPAMENLATLTGKYGEEGDRLIFKILNSGDFLKEAREKHLDMEQPAKWVNHISEKALRYDLTVPFARFVAMNRNDLAFPFKRYQMQPVWRADRPQKGRYREFWQCDADVVGSRSLLNEAELICIYDQVFSDFNLPVNIHLNNRKVLAGIAEITGKPDQLTDLTVAIDKLDKIGEEKVLDELRLKGFTDVDLNKLKPIFNLPENNSKRLEFLDTFLADSATGKQGISELRLLLNYFTKGAFELKGAHLHMDITLARGLNYYTGTILEVKARDIDFGSIGGGGRYDDLTGIFGLPDVPGVGISFGADRIYDVLLLKNLFPANVETGTQVLIANFGPEDERYALPLLSSLRSSGIPAELYPEAEKLRKQFEYADKKGIPYFIIYGEGERKAGKAVVKQLQSGAQKEIPIDSITHFTAHFD